MTILNCKECGGTHFGSTKCPYLDAPTVAPTPQEPRDSRIFSVCPECRWKTEVETLEKHRVGCCRPIDGRLFINAQGDMVPEPPAPSGATAALVKRLSTGADGTLAMNIEGWRALLREAADALSRLSAEGQPEKASEHIGRAFLDAWDKSVSRDFERLKQQALVIEKILRDAGIPSMPLDSGVQELARRAEAQTWQPMETCEDGARVLTRMKHGCIEGVWNKQEGTCTGYYWQDICWYPSAWMPVPPVSTGTGREGAE